MLGGLFYPRNRYDQCWLTHHPAKTGTLVYSIFTCSFTNSFANRRYTNGPMFGLHCHNTEYIHYYVLHLLAESVLAIGFSNK